MEFFKVSPVLLIGWNQFFYWSTIISGLSAVALFGVPYVSINSFPFRLRAFAGVDRMRIQRFFGRITGYTIMLLALVVLAFVFESVYSVVVAVQLSIAGTQDINKINGLLAYAIAFVVSCIFVYLSARWFRKQWDESATDSLPNSESTQLREVMNRLNSKLDKLDKLDKIDKLVTTLERQEKEQQTIQRKGKRG